MLRSLDIRNFVVYHPSHFCEVIFFSKVFQFEHFGNFIFGFYEYSYEDFLFIVVDVLTTQVFSLVVLFYCLLHELCDACRLCLYSFSCSVEYNVWQLSETDIILLFGYVWKLRQLYFMSQAQEGADISGILTVMTLGM